MDTCSRLGEPGGVGWKEVDGGRLQRTTSDKRLTWWLRAVDRSARLPRNLVYAIPCYDGGWSSVGPGWSRRRRRGAPQRRRRCRRRTMRRRENGRLRMERDILKNYSAPWRACAA